MYTQVKLFFFFFFFVTWSQYGGVSHRNIFHLQKKFLQPNKPQNTTTITMFIDERMSFLQLIPKLQINRT